MLWETLITETDLARLLPESEQRFAAPVREALVMFLGNLSDARQAAILQRQAELPAGTTLASRLAALAAECPVLHKLAQVIARDRRIEPELRAELSQLESMPVSLPLDEIERELEREIGPLRNRNLRLEPPALAEASVAVVVPYANETGTIQGVFKVLKPGIEQRLTEELALLSKVAGFLDEACERLQLPELDYQETFDQVRDKIVWELRLDQEQKHLRAAHQLYANDPQILIPELHEYCTPRVTAMQRVWGTKVTESPTVASETRQLLANSITRAMIAKPVFSMSSQAMFHSDPHAGNLLATPDGRLAILDWSLVGYLGEQERQAIAQILLGGVMLCPAKVQHALQRLATLPLRQAADLQTVVQQSIAQLALGRLPSMQWLVSLLDRAALEGGLRVSADMMLFRKSLLTLAGVLNDLGDDGQQQDKLMLSAFAKQFAMEWPLRWINWPASRSYSTRLSNCDMAEAAQALPWAISRRMAGAGFDRLERWLLTPPAPN